MVTALHSQDHRTGSEEQERFEEGMRHQMEHAGDIRAHPDCRHHEAQLADGGIGEYLFNIVLADRNRGGEEGGRRPNQSDHDMHTLDSVEDRGRAGHQIYASGDHRGGMDQGRDRGRASHGIRQPDDTAGSAPIYRSHPGA